MKVAAYQAPLHATGTAEVIGLIRERVNRCESEDVEILCCPEGVLGGLADYASRPADIAVNEKSSAPLHRQIYETICGSIPSGEFHVGRQLPAARLLARQLGVARMTVVNAYEQLMAEGYLTSRTGAGTFVAEHLPEEFSQAASFGRQQQPEGRHAREALPSDYGKHLACDGRVILCHSGAARVVPFQHSVPAVAEFPFRVRAVNVRGRAPHG